MATAGEIVEAVLVAPETTFDESVHRHLTVLVLTPTRLIRVHVDDLPLDDGTTGAMATSEAVALPSIRSVAISHGVANPEKHGGALGEITIAIAWGAVQRMEMEHAQCPDPECTADHGYTATIMPDDIALRVSAAVEGPAAVAKAALFAQALSAATARAMGAAI